MTAPTRTRRDSKIRRNIIWGVVIAVVAVLAVGASIAYSLSNRSEPKPQAAGQKTEQPTPTISPTSSPASTPSPTPTADKPVRSLPGDCRSIYTPAFLDLWEGVPLNDPLLADVGISRYDGVETLRKSLPGIECKWGGPTEGGMSNALNQVTAAQAAALTAAATVDGFTCNDGPTATVCTISEGPSGDEGWVVAEELYVRDGLLVTTWRASTAGSIADSTQPVYDTLWP